MDEETEQQRLNNLLQVIQGESTSLEPRPDSTVCALTWTLDEEVFASMSKGMDGDEGHLHILELQEVIMIGA